MPDRLDTLNALYRQGNLKEVVEQAGKLRDEFPQTAEVHNILGAALNDLGRVDEAIASYRQAAGLAPENARYWRKIAKVLAARTFDSYDPSAAGLFVEIIDKQTLVSPSEILGPVIKLLRLHPLIAPHLRALPSLGLNEGAEKVICELGTIPLLLRIMGVCPFTDVAFEKLFTGLRRALLFGLDGISDRQTVLTFQVALAVQGWVNEFVYGETPDERNALDTLEQNLSASFDREDPAGNNAIACIASFRPLHRYAWSSALTDRDALRPIIQTHVSEFAEEAALRAGIPTLKPIADRVSRSVREQYEHNPYPRWVSTRLFPPSQQAPAVLPVASNMGLNVSDTETLRSPTPDILIAGCGTGRQALQTATLYPNSQVLAVDLSLSSLSYAKRKTRALGVTNIAYMQADILDLDQLDKSFDVVECAGVLHHMDDPFAGWQVLERCLKPGGLLRIALYSELGRQPIAAARQKISELGLSSSTEDILTFRAKILESNSEDLRAIRMRPDFFSTSEFRDLVFHVQEHRLTLPQIQECLARLYLTFIGFENVGGGKAVRGDPRFSEPGALYDLDKWHAFELAHPNFFANMYRFWAQKPV